MEGFLEEEEEEEEKETAQDCSGLGHWDGSAAEFLGDQISEKSCSITNF